MKLSTKLVVEALGDSYYPDQGQSVNAETMISVLESNPIIKNSEDIKRALTDSLELLKFFTYGEYCDHSVNICYCQAFRVKEELTELVEKL